MKPDKFNNPHQTGTPGAQGGLNKGNQGGAGTPQGKQQWGGGTANQQGKKPMGGTTGTNKGRDEDTTTRRDK